MKLNLELTAIIHPAEEGGFVAFLEEMPNICSQGESLEEVKYNLSDAFEMVMDTQRMLSRNKKYPKETIKEQIEFA